jgi:hypothetical protein
MAAHHTPTPNLERFSCVKTFTYGRTKITEIVENIEIGATDKGDEYRVYFVGSNVKIGPYFIKSSARNERYLNGNMFKAKPSNIRAYSGHVSKKNFSDSREHLVLPISL